MTGAEYLRTWGGENISVSYFINAPHKSSSTDLFRIAFDDTPETTNDINNPQFGRLGVSTSPRKKGRVHSIQLQPGRCDVVLHPAGDEVGAGGFPELIEDIGNALDFACDAALRLASEFHVVSRLAINLRVSRHFADLRSANAEIEKVLPVEFNAGELRDFIIQLNSRATIGQREINRLMKWSTEPVQVFAEAAFGQFLSPGTPNQMLIREFWAAAVQYDFNTVVPAPIFTTEEARESITTIKDYLIAARREEIFT